MVYKYQIKHYFKSLFSTSGRMTPSAFWSDAAVKVISCLCAIIVMSIVLSVVLPAETEEVTRIAEWVACGLMILWCLPVLRNTRRRLRDAGYTAKAYLWLLLPIVGWIVFIALLWAKSTQTTSESSDGIMYSFD